MDASTVRPPSPPPSPTPLPPYRFETTPCGLPALAATRAVAVGEVLVPAEAPLLAWAPVEDGAALEAAMMAAGGRLARGGGPSAGRGSCPPEEDGWP